MAAAVEFTHLPKDRRHMTARSAGDLQDWLAWLELGGKSPRTLYSYEWAVARLLRAHPDRQLHEFTDSDLLRVLRTFPARSRRTKTAAYRSWFDWAALSRRIADNPMLMVPSGGREKQRYIPVFTDAEVATLEALPMPDGPLMQLLFDTGIRRGEAIRLQARDCQLADQQIVVLQGKGGKDRLIPMTIRLQERLAGWFLLDGIQPDDHLWAARPGGYQLRRTKPMGQTSFQKWWTDAVAASGVGYRNAHVTRHTFATRWLRRGGKLITLSRAMGHTSIRTTADLYGHLDVSDIAADMLLVEGHPGDH